LLLSITRLRLIDGATHSINLLLFSYVKGVIFVARRFILIDKNTHPIAITTPNPSRMLNVNSSSRLGNFSQHYPR